MDEIVDRENTERKILFQNFNTEYVPTKCRITKPPPPKPATNPLQFIKVAPCALYQKAHEQIKKVEETKVLQQEIKEEVEDWQMNLDNWKSCRRKRQQPIIERVVEVKKFEQGDHERGRRKSKTFNEMLEDRNKRGHRLNIALFEEDPNDFSDYGIGSNSSKANSVKDVDTDDSSSILDDKDQPFDTLSNKDTSSASNQSQSEDETVGKSNDSSTSVNDLKRNSSPKLTNTYRSTLSTNISNKPNYLMKSSSQSLLDSIDTKFDTHQYTYEGAIQDYRSRIRSKINVDESVFIKSQEFSKSKEFTEAQALAPKGNIFKCKEIFEVEKPVEIQQHEINSIRRLSEDLANTQTIKERLQSLEKCADQPLPSVSKKESKPASVKNLIKDFSNKNSDADVKNNNMINTKVKEHMPKTISSYLLDKSSNNTGFECKQNGKSVTDWRGKDEISDRSSSPEVELYMNKLNIFNRDLDNLFGKSSNQMENGLEDYSVSTCSTELIGVSSDREDSGIHTADVSCSVSQADESVEDAEFSTIPNCIEKLTKEREKLLHCSNGLLNNNKDLQQEELSDQNVLAESLATLNELLEKTQQHKIQKSTQVLIMPYVISTIEDFLNDARRDASENCQQNFVKTESSNLFSHIDTSEMKPVYENIDIRPYQPMENYGVMFTSPLFPLSPHKIIEPPKEKPPPPPPIDEEDEPKQVTVKRLNSTKRIKKELHIKRSSFLGLDEPTDDQLDPEIMIDRPPDINSFLQKESQLEKSLYKKLQRSREGGLSEIESQDSGLESERGRLSSDTWCSSIADSGTSTHGRQDSEQTNSTNSEEDEITKKEREIIEMVEKEEKSRDCNDFPKQNFGSDVPYDNTVTVKGYNNTFYKQKCSNFTGALDDQDSEVLKVEHELLQLEREEKKRRQENLLFRESRMKTHQNNRYSLENLCDTVDTHPAYSDASNYRKSMPELPNDMHSKLTTDVPKYYKSSPESDMQHRKSMPDIQQAYHKSIVEYCKSVPEVYNNLHMPIEHRKSMPELQHDMQMSAFRMPVSNRQPIAAGKPIRPYNKEHRDKERFMMVNPIESDALQCQNDKQMRTMTRHSLQALSAAPRPRPIHNDNWIQPKANLDSKNYSQHWLYQEAELRRLSDQQKNTSNQNRNWNQVRQEKHIPDPIIQTLTQRVQNRNNQNERNQSVRRIEGSPSKDYNQHPYLGHAHTVGHASPLSYPSPAIVEESQDKVLSVSGKKRCSYCNNELGRGAAMIIESLCLFYHMECFKCCVCNMQLGDGFMGTDVRVRNQKLHCHNCYSSDDGVKFSCV